MDQCTGSRAADFTKEEKKYYGKNMKANTYYKQHRHCRQSKVLYERMGALNLK